MNMKKFKIVMVALVCCASVFSSCKKEEKIVTDGKAELLSFGFYAADNGENLAEDYVAQVSDEMVIRLPEGTDRTKLVARFTVGVDDALTLSGAMQASGKTPADYSYPVDFIVKDTVGNVSASYTVKIAKILQMKWAEVASYNDVDASGTVLSVSDYAMTLSQKDATPYFIVSSNGTSTGLNEARVGYLDGSALSMGGYITTKEDGTAVTGKNLDVAVDADGKVYGFYYYSTEKKCYVKTGSGSSWSIVGAPFGGTSLSSYAAMDADPVSKKPVAAYMANAAVSGSITKRDLDLCYYDGSAWTSENLLPDGFSGTYNYCVNMKAVGGALYLAAVAQVAPGAYYILKYNGAQGWTQVIKALPAGASQSSIYGLAFDIASDGTAYLCVCSDEDENKTWKLSVYKSSSDFSSWERVSTAITGDNKYFNMALCKDSPVVVYKDATLSVPMIVTLNPETLAWNEPVALMDTEISTKAISVDFTSDGVGYAAVVDSKDVNALHVFKYSLEDDDLVK